VARPDEGDAPSFGAGEEPKGDAFAVFPAGTRREPAPEAKPTHSDAITGDAAGSVIDLAARLPEAGASVVREADSLVTVRPKPEKRKNAKERAKEKYAGKTAAGETMPETTAEAKPKAAKAKAATAERKEKAKKAKSGR